METSFQLVEPERRSAELFSALGSRQRLRILALLIERPMHLGEIVGRVGLAQSTVSQHLAVLRDAELVTYEVEGPRHVYRLRPEALIELRGAVNDLVGTPGVEF